jgi:UDP-GlcNAc:undecaprenyl-phosphate GlcNAc-1-phosphate transferase
VAVYLVLIIAAISALFMVPFCIWLLKLFSLKCRNYRNVLVLYPGGIVFPLGITLSLITGKAVGIYDTTDVVCLSALTWGFGILGFVDDIVGDPSYHGFKGHMKALLQKTITTGALKALAGGVLSLFVGIYFARGNLYGLGIGIATALSANMINLLDRAPGRALKGFFCIVSLGALFSLGALINTVMPFLVMIIVYFPADIREEVMMGDTGSNILGSILGYSLVTSVSFRGGILYTLLFFLINIVGEVISFSKIIEKNRFLCFVDRLGRKRLENDCHII